MKNNQVTHKQDTKIFMGKGTGHNQVKFSTINDNEFTMSFLEKYLEVITSSRIPAFLD